MTDPKYSDLQTKLGELQPRRKPRRSGGRMSTKELEMVPVTSEEVSPEEYLRIHAKDPGMLASVSIRPPTLGRGGFGRIVVEYKNPLYRYQLGGRIGR